MVTWRDWEYLPIDQHLGAGAAVEMPEHWSAGVRSLEATNETLLAFNLLEFTGLPLRLLKRAFPLESAPDIVATDALRRVHLFELKMRSVPGEAAAQLEQYLLRHVFGDADVFLASAARSGERQTTLLRLARDIAGVWANERIETVGFGRIVRHLNNAHPLLNPEGRRFTQYRWNHSSDEERINLIYAALTIHASENGLSMPAMDEILASAGMREPLLNADSESSSARLMAERRIVVWLVGSSISAQALERVRLWRRSGIDARVLRLTARSDGRCWVAGVRREATPQRDRIEQELFNRACDESQRQARVKAVFYDERAPSTSSRLGGGLLEKPKITYR